jgi:hypothetical protein
MTRLAVQRYHSFSGSVRQKKAINQSGYFSAMLDPFISLALSIGALLALGIYNFVFKGRQKGE